MQNRHSEVTPLSDTITNLVENATLHHPELTLPLKTTLELMHQSDIPEISQAFSIITATMTFYEERQGAFAPHGRGMLMLVEHISTGEAFYVERKKEPFDLYVILRIDPEKYLLMAEEERQLSFVHEATHVDDLLNAAFAFEYTADKRIKTEYRALVNEYNAYARMGSTYMNTGREAVLNIVEEFDVTPQYVLMEIAKLHVVNPTWKSYEVLRELKTRF